MFQLTIDNIAGAGLARWPAGYLLGVGGLEGRLPSGCPSKNSFFSLVASGDIAGHKRERVDLGRQASPNPITASIL
jgi:hypothetical protein